MKTLLLLGVALLMNTSVARADHLGVYSDGSGASCALAPGFTSTATVLHKFTLGTRGSSFGLELPAGSVFFGFSTAFSPPLPPEAGTITLDYGTCLQGSFVVGTIVAILEPGTLWVRPGGGLANVMVTDCDLVEKAATCGGAYVGPNLGYCPSCETVATEQTTWGAVKSLYRE